MTTVAIQPILDTLGQRSYRAVAGNKQSYGKTAGQALDALTNQLGETEFSGVFVLQSFPSKRRIRPASMAGKVKILGDIVSPIVHTIQQLNLLKKSMVVYMRKRT
ncbi:MAG: hypothetical protein KME29_37990 [Calothrix sp. FI2-JRJ7]|jgi:hypothetical protein|nr:hypothetical protein [Calothrix sp. FI2-JRJ7]